MIKEDCSKQSSVVNNKTKHTISIWFILYLIKNFKELYLSQLALFSFHLFLMTSGSCQKPVSYTQNQHCFTRTWRLHICHSSWSKHGLLYHEIGSRCIQDMYHYPTMGKNSHLRLPMDVACSPDIFQAKMSELMKTLCLFELILMIYYASPRVAWMTTSVNWNGSSSGCEMHD
jgi:hypothetical protein